MQTGNWESPVNTYMKLDWARGDHLNAMNTHVTQCSKHLSFKPLQKCITNWSSSLCVFKLCFPQAWKQKKNTPQPWFFGRKHTSACFELKQYMEVKEGTQWLQPMVRNITIKKFLPKKYTIGFFLANVLVCTTFMQTGLWGYAYLLFGLDEYKYFFRSELHSSSIELCEAYPFCNTPREN